VGPKVLPTIGTIVVVISCAAADAADRAMATTTSASLISTFDGSDYG
jgi:hypothetical protein